MLSFSSQGAPLFCKNSLTELFSYANVKQTLSSEMEIVLKMKKCFLGKVAKVLDLGCSRENVWLRRLFLSFSIEPQWRWWERWTLKTLFIRQYVILWAQKRIAIVPRKLSMTQTYLRVQNLSSHLYACYCYYFVIGLPELFLEHSFLNPFLVLFFRSVCSFT